MKKEGYWRKTIFGKKNTGSRPSSLGSWVDPPGRPGFARLLPGFAVILDFYWMWSCYLSSHSCYLEGNQLLFRITVLSHQKRKQFIYSCIICVVTYHWGRWGKCSCGMWMRFKACKNPMERAKEECFDAPL
jgi:hypothetical protein